MNILGMGIDAIEVSSLRDDSKNLSVNDMKNISLRKIVIGNYQPRKKGKITLDTISDLVLSIKEKGVLQPIIVRDLGDETYKVIAGERRYLAAKEANLQEIPCVIKNVNEQDAFAIALIENIQREQLSLLEVSESLWKLKDEHFLSVEDVSKIVGKPRTTVANLIRAASLLSYEGKLLWEEGTVDYGHIRSVIILNHEFQNLVLQYVVDNNLSVRDTERFIREKIYLNLGNKISKKDVKENYLSAEKLNDMSTKFSSIYSKNVNIKGLRSGKIRVAIEFENLKQTYEYLNEKY
jgi:ParB family chromosome partitioning protein